MEAFKNENIISNFSKYLLYKEIIYLSLINKNTYYLLNPIKNPIINTLFRNITYKRFYFNEISDEEEETQKTEEIYDDYKFTNNNWKLIYNSLLINYNHYQNKDIADLIYNCFKNHLFLPGIRKTNKYLEFQFSSLHQQIFYDFLQNKKFTFNYYDKYFNENGLIKLNSNAFILKKQLFFENNIINFNEILLSFKNNNNLKNILKIIIQYDYNFLDIIYMKNNNITDEIIKFLLFLNHTVKLFSKFIYHFIILYANSNNNKIKDNKLLLEYITKHNDFINFGLLVDENFNNINIIINYLNKFIFMNNNNNKSFNYFSIYKMCINIFKKEIYDKIENSLKIKFEKINNNYINDLFDESNNEKHKEQLKNDNNESNSNTKEDSNSNSSEDFEYSSDMENDDNSLINENREITNKEIIEHFMNCITDFNINEFNANVINHSELKINDDYKIYENILINSFINNIDKYLLNEEKSVDSLLLIIRNTFSIQNENINYIQSENGNTLNIIKRTKKNVFCKIMNHLKEYTTKKIKEELLKFIEKYDKNNFIKFNDEKIILDNILNDEEKSKLNDEKKNIFFSIYQNEINKITNDLINDIKNKKLKIHLEGKNLSNIINCFCNSNNSFVIILQKMLYYYYIEEIYYSKMDTIIANILIKGKNNNYPLFINESLTKI